LGPPRPPPPPSQHAFSQPQRRSYVCVCVCVSVSVSVCVCVRVCVFTLRVLSGWQRGWQRLHDIICMLSQKWKWWACTFLSFAFLCPSFANHLHQIICIKSFASNHLHFCARQPILVCPQKIHFWMGTDLFFGLQQSNEKRKSRENRILRCPSSYLYLCAYVCVRMCKYVNVCTVVCVCMSVCAQKRRMTWQRGGREGTGREGVMFSTTKVSMHFLKLSLSLSVSPFFSNALSLSCSLTLSLFCSLTLLLARLIVCSHSHARACIFSSCVHTYICIYIYIYIYIYVYIYMYIYIFTYVYMYLYT